MPALDTPGLTTADRHWVAHRHLNRCGWWAERLRIHGGDAAAAGCDWLTFERVMRAERAEVIPERHDAWDTGLAAGRVAFG